MVTGPFSVIPVKTGGCNQLAPAASPAVNAVRLTVSVPVCSTGATSPFPLPLKSEPKYDVQPGSSQLLSAGMRRMCAIHDTIVRHQRCMLGVFSSDLQNDITNRLRQMRTPKTMRAASATCRSFWCLTSPHPAICLYGAGAQEACRAVATGGIISKTWLNPCR